jgi:hypothetical protein
MTVKQIHSFLDTMSPERDELDSKKVTMWLLQTWYNNERKYNCIYSRKATYRSTC